MKRFAAAVLFLSFLFSIPTFAQSVKNPLWIMPLGDSLTAGGYNENGQYLVGGGYRTLLWQLLNQGGYAFGFVGQFQDGPAELPDKHHEGHSGWRIDQLAAGAGQWVGNSKPDVVMLLIGTNDIVQNWDLANAPVRLGALVDEIRAAAPKAAILISNLIPTNNYAFNDRIADYNSVVERLVRDKATTDRKIFFVDLFNGAQLRDGADGGESDLIDGVHPTPHGYDLMAQAWYDALGAVLGPVRRSKK